jgi:hypothetical protein
MAARKEKITDTVQMTNAVQHCIDKARVSGIKQALQAKLRYAMASQRRWGRELTKLRCTQCLDGVQKLDQF